jgi:hypothetical protein
MADSCASRDSWFSGCGCKANGAVEARGGMDIRDASGAVV